ncbi:MULTISPECIES: AMP-binding protein [unclassified Dysgonomonas]|jgi:O-succinylbenzoic acid--CoA ligase|uniref:AMP-binding protein n=1 Tax=unclassified Dysgonomonas TaxID=2630389 RepID=UPI0025C47BF7|nr:MULTISPECIES: AMP-binding protein [unclassified Dysgonomonas]MDR2002359.1 AMP-binding protein [Prevotella sp.]HMM01731.1 AMP-binding protein [Dysgonomonas sp.]
MYQLYIKRQIITIDGGSYTPDIFRSKGIPAFALKSDFHYSLYLFLKEWFSRSPLIRVQTSGSTGIPKEMMVEKERMMRSAEFTCSFLGLKEGNKALLCMSLDYIAGKMMVVRALIAGLDLYPVTPSGNPLKDTKVTFDFAAMIPMQVYNSLESDKERKKLEKIKNLIIGGGAIDSRLEEKLKTHPNKIYSTYGMTETLSHIALRRLNGESASGSYIPFPSVALSLSDDNTLIIDAPLVTSEKLYTNDIAEIDKDGSFRITGRKDNVINSGGIKIQIEEVEKILKPLINSSFAVTSLPDPKFGEVLILAVEEDIDPAIFKDIQPAYYTPKKIIKVDKIPLTETGKISRVELKKLVNEL